MDKILVVDDESDIRRALKLVLSETGYNVDTASNGIEAINKLKTEDFDLVITDLRMEGIDGFGVLEKSLEINTSTPVIIITAYGSVESAVEAMKRGAADYIVKPFLHEDIKLTIKRILEHSKLSLENQRLRQQLSQQPRYKEVIGISEAILKIYETIEKIAPTKANVFITGESGTGKGLLAEVIHSNSPRKDRPFISINCAAIPENLLESELFGYKKGAFTGASHDKAGLIVLAHEGTLFLDEIGDMPLLIQSKLLRVLESGEVTPLGGTKNKVVDIRIISSTNKDIEACVKDKSLREDLYYRLNVVEIKMPALREREGDIPVLADYFLKKFIRDTDKEIKGFNQSAMNALISHQWPGNIRELRNVIERAVILSEGNKITPSDLSEKVKTKTAPVHDTTPDGSLKSVIHEYEKEVILNALKKTTGNKELAAKSLGIDLATLYRKMNKYYIKE